VDNRRGNKTDSRGKLFGPREALELAAEILKMEFAETEGSGKETFLKCEKVLERTKSVMTVRLSLC